MDTIYNTVLHADLLKQALFDLAHILEPVYDVFVHSSSHDVHILGVPIATPHSLSFSLVSIVCRVYVEWGSPHCSYMHAMIIIMAKIIMLLTSIHIHVCMHSTNIVQYPCRCTCILIMAVSEHELVHALNMAQGIPLGFISIIV